MSHSIETRCVHGEEHKFKDEFQSLSTPIYQTAAFGHPDLGHSPERFYYTRLTNPTRLQVEETVSSLEGAADTVAFTSGMAAITAVFQLFSPGDRIVCSADLYGGTVLLFDLIEKKKGLVPVLVDTTDEQALRAAVTPDTRAIYIETPSNPMMNITDLSACAEIAKEHGLLLIVDNTFLSPYLQNPIELGADIVLHSGSKFLSGHNDTISGFLSCASRDLADRVRLIAKTTGGVLAPFDCWLVLRGLKTLPVRMERQQENARKVAQWLSVQPQVCNVYYAGLPQHPGYAVNARQARGGGSMISFRTDSVETARRVLKKVKLITFAESLGGTESLITYPMVQTHPDVPQAMRERLGITETLLRLSVGLEHVDDIIHDLKQALEE